MSHSQISRTLQEGIFAVFCIESIARRLGVGGNRVYAALAEKSNLLSDYVIANYDALHTQDKDYVVDDILGVMACKGVTI